MKKIFILVAVVATFSFSSCGNSSKPATNADSTTVAADGEATDTASTVVSSVVDKLTAGLKSGDAKSVATTLGTAQAKIVELAKNNPEQAKEYVNQVQTWLIANKDAIKKTLAKANNTALTNAVNTAIASVSAIDPSDVVNSAKNLALPALKDAAANAVNSAVETKGGVENATSEAVNAAKEAMKNAPADVKEKAAEAKGKMGDAANKALKDLGL